MIRWILDPGHADWFYNEYLTPGKRTHKIPPGFYEGVFNAKLARAIMVEADRRGILTETIQTNCDPSLGSRVRLVKRMVKTGQHCVLLSLHTNASTKSGWGKASGTTIFCRKKPAWNKKIYNKSRRLAEIFKTKLTHNGFRMRGIKEKNFTMVRKPPCESILIELVFHDNLDDVKRISDPAVFNTQVKRIVDAMEQYEQ